MDIRKLNARQALQTSARSFYFLEGELMTVGVDFYGVAVDEFAGQKLGSQRVLQLLLDRTLDRPCSEDRIIALVHDLFSGTVGKFDLDVADVQTFGKVI